MARPKSFANPATVKALLNALKLGLSLRTAGKIAGVTPQTVRTECARNPAFFAQIKQATAECERALVGLIYNAAKRGTWTAAAWLLERKFHDRWGRRAPQPDTAPQQALPGDTITGDLALDKQEPSA